jgi:hypothetical protein
MLDSIYLFSQNQKSTFSENSYSHLQNNEAAFGISLAPAPLIYQTMRVDFDYFLKDSPIGIYIAPTLTLDEGEDGYAFTNFENYRIFGYGAEVGVKYYAESKGNANFFLGLNGSFLAAEITHSQSVIVPGNNIDGFPVLREDNINDQESNILRLTGEVITGIHVVTKGRAFAELWTGIGLMNSNVTSQRYEGVGTDDLFGESIYFGYGVYFSAGVKIGLLFVD